MVVNLGDELMRMSIIFPIFLLSGCVCAPVVVNDTIQLPCCGTGGAGQPVNISTRTGPWRVTLPNLTSSQAAVPASNVAWVPPSDPHFSVIVPVDWVGPPGQWDAEGDYRYEVRFDAPVCRTRRGQPAMVRSITVSGVFASDDRAAVFFGPSTIPVVSQPASPPGFHPGAVTPFTVTIPAPASGIYTLRVDVHNDGGPTGLIVQATAASTCGPAT